MWTLYFIVLVFPGQFIYFSAFGVPLGIDVFKFVLYNYGRLLYCIPLSYPQCYYIYAFLTSRQEFVIFIMRMSYPWDLLYLIRLLHAWRLLYFILSVILLGFIIFNPLVTPLGPITLNIFVILLEFIIFKPFVHMATAIYLYIHYSTALAILIRSYAFRLFFLFYFPTTTFPLNIIHNSQ